MKRYANEPVLESPWTGGGKSKIVVAPSREFCRLHQRKGRTMRTRTAYASDFSMPRPLARIAAPRPATYEIEARRIVEGKAVGEPFTVTQDAELPANWEFRLIVDAPAEYVYLLHPSSRAGKGEQSWVMLPPSSPHHGMRWQARTGWLGFDGAPGIERLYLIWSEKPIEGFPASPRLEPVPVEDSSEVGVSLRDAPHCAHTLLALKHC